MEHPPRTLLKCSRFRVEQVVENLTDGRVRTRELIRHPGAVVILPFVDEDHVCLIRNYRTAAAQTLIELPAGTREPNEPPELTAARELHEETGFRAGHIEFMMQFYPSPGIMDEQMLVYVARELQPGPPQREVGEQIENLVTPWEVAIQWTIDGTIQDAKTICSLLSWQARRRHG